MNFSSISYKRRLETVEEGPDKKRAKVNFEEFFPDEVYLKIFKHLGIVELCRLSCVSKKFNRLSEDQSLWDVSNLVSNIDFPHLPLRQKNLYKEFYIKQLILKNFHNKSSIDLLNKYNITPHSSLTNIYKGLHEAFLGNYVDTFFKNLNLHQENVTFSNEITDEFMALIFDAWYKHDYHEPVDILNDLLKPLHRLHLNAASEYSDRLTQSLENHQEDLADLCDLLIKNENPEGLALKLRTLISFRDTIFDRNGRVFPLFPTKETLEKLKGKMENNLPFCERLEVYINLFELMEKAFNLLASKREATAIIQSISKLIETSKISF